ncbi:hypothetical protein MCOR25_001388, partial [Pyricularia grisea]
RPTYPLISDLQTVELSDEFLETMYLHGRVYQRYAIENGAYFGPVDEDEVERLYIMHQVFTMLFDRRLIFPPIRRPKRILDCGFGTGSWAIEVADQHPNCEVVGVDINPMMIPETLPRNLNLQVDDLNGPFTFASDSFDLVHSRMVAGGIHADRWEGYMEDIYRVLVPGGWCQMVEMSFVSQSDNGTLTEYHALSQWSEKYRQSQSPYKDPDAASQLATLMMGAGFVDVEARDMPLPMSAWSNNARERSIGAANRDNVHKLLASLATYPFAQGLGMSLKDIHLLVAQARNEAENPAYKAYFRLYVCIGRKPR